MSKKTVTFKLPVREAPRSEDEPGRVPSSGEEPTSPLAQLTGRETEQTEVSERDQWVRSREADRAPADTVAPSPSRAPGSVTIDLTAERDFPNVAALMLTIPPMIGWFYLANIMNRYWNRLG
jgi:hypothetical protein